MFLYNTFYDIYIRLIHFTYHVRVMEENYPTPYSYRRR